MDYRKIYANRFLEDELPARNRIWKTICKRFLGRFIPPEATVVDVGAGFCEFINHIECRKKIAVDVNPDVRKYANRDVEVILEPCTAMPSLGDGSADVVFMSNVLEHLPNKQQVFDALKEARRVLKTGGKVLILQPNIRFLPHNYWDFFDHHTPLSDRSLAEALEVLDMRVVKNIPRFLPYTTKTKMPKGSMFIELYLHIPWVWPLFGKQAFIAAEKS